LVREKSSGITRTGNPYLRLKLADRSSEMEARIWTPAETCAETFEKDDFVRIKGKAVSYLEHIQLNVTQVERADEKRILLEDFFPTTDKDIDGMLQSLIQASEKMGNPHLRRLLSLFWEDRDFIEQLKKAPASKKIHHAFIGGLLEHTLSLTELVVKNCSHYEGLDLDLLVTGAILHDLGKVEELSYHRSFDYSDRGRLLGHIILGLEKVGEKIRQLPDFPEDLSLVLKHLLLSHHGQYVYGSPKKPMTLEAVMLHYLDDMDAKINGIKEFLRTHSPEGSRWSAYHPVFEQSYYRAIPQVQGEARKIGEDDLEEE
ncbi:MAG: HD domain-containing protein, partial [Deltaproteobacteria bacterium]